MISQSELSNLFVSEETRLKRINSVRKSGFPFFKDLAFDNSSNFLDFDFKRSEKPEVCRNILSKQLYFQEKTTTFVHHLRDNINDMSIVMKTYLIRDKNKKKVGKPQHDIEIRFLTLFSNLLRLDITPHITLPIGRSIISAEDAKGLVCKKSLPDGKYHVILSEFIDTSLTPLVRKEELTGYQLKVILFQVVYTLRVIQAVLPSFRHNDLHTSNVLVQRIEAGGMSRAYPEDVLCSRYMVDGRFFYHRLKDCPFRALLWDFYFSTVSRQDAVKEEVFDIVSRQFEGTSFSKPNCYFDLHKLFDSLEFCLKQTSKKYQEEHKELQELIDLVVPLSLKCMSVNRSPESKKKLKLSDIQKIDPETLLKQKYFFELRKKPKNFLLLKKYSGDAAFKSQF